jgi:hypothetical protein
MEARKNHIAPMDHPLNEGRRRVKVRPVIAAKPWLPESAFMVEKLPSDT